jgi:hypothetical protein
MSWKVAMIAGAIRQRTIRGSMVMQRDRISGRERIATPYRCLIFGNQPKKGAAGKHFPRGQSWRRKRHGSISRNREAATAKSRNRDHVFLAPSERCFLRLLPLMTGSTIRAGLPFPGNIKIRDI